MRRAGLLVVLTAICTPLLAQQQTFRSSVDVVSVPVSVTDKNRPVANLTAADFELLDNGVKQEVTLTTLDAMPTDVTFVVDVSGSINGKALERIKQDAQQMSDLLQPNDRVRLVSFARDPVDVFGLLPGGATLDFSRMRAGGTTSLYDALVDVLVAHPATDRPHMVFVVTDGRDNSSFSTAAHVVDVAGLSSAVLCVALVPSSNPLVREGSAVDTIDPMASEQSTVMIPGLSGSPALSSIGASSGPSPTAVSRSVGPYRGGPNVDALKNAAAATGGLVYPDASRTPIPQLFRRVLDDFRAGYVLTFAPAGVEATGTHTLTVRVKGRNVVVRARKTYEVR